MDQDREKLTEDEKWWTRLERLAPRELTEEEKEVLWNHINSDIFLQASTNVLVEKEALMNQFLTLPLGSPEGSAAAIAIQASVKGLLRTFGLLVEQAKKKENSDG